MKSNFVSTDVPALLEMLRASEKRLKRSFYLIPWRQNIGLYDYSPSTSIGDDPAHDARPCEGERE